MGVRFMIDGDEAGGGFSAVQHPMSPRVRCRVTPQLE